MKTDKIILVKEEQDLLKKHLKDMNLSIYNKTKLLSELEAASIVKETDMPDDAIRIQSKVEIREKISGKKYDFQIVLPSQANMKENKISVFAPIGIALIGYRTGAKVQWEMPDGIKTFTVLNVRHNR